ncbi:MAG TPA: CoA-binding protein [Thermoflexales bacterium]|nr:CoA-binding protein [Thermoflexales bacterium]HQZ53907.1 CoA-binding protein [Thermoflexales bacterium]HRA52780.1 CoA-binding protein [Thermoflexales bacterium]
MTDDEIKDILKRIRVIASVGLSADETKDSFGVATYLKRARYTIVPVNPRADRILGSKAYPDLAAVPVKVDAVQVFRPPAEAMKIVEDAIKIGASVVWMQEGIINEEAAARGRSAGLAVVMDRCMMQEHRRLMGTPMQ